MLSFLPAYEIVKLSLVVVSTEVFFNLIEFQFLLQSSFESFLAGSIPFRTSTLILLTLHGSHLRLARLLL